MVLESVTGAGKYRLGPARDASQSAVRDGAGLRIYIGLTMLVVRGGPRCAGLRRTIDWQACDDKRECLR